LKVSAVFSLESPQSATHSVRRSGFLAIWLSGCLLTAS